MSGLETKSKQRRPCRNDDVGPMSLYSNGSIFFIITAYPWLDRSTTSSGNEGRHGLCAEYRYSRLPTANEALWMSARLCELPSLSGIILRRNQAASLERYILRLLFSLRVLNTILYPICKRLPRSSHRHTSRSPTRCRSLALIYTPDKVEHGLVLDIRVLCTIKRKDTAGGKWIIGVPSVCRKMNLSCNMGIVHVSSESQWNCTDDVEKLDEVKTEGKRSVTAEYRSIADVFVSTMSSREQVEHTRIRMQPSSSLASSDDGQMRPRSPATQFAKLLSFDHNQNITVLLARAPGERGNISGSADDFIVLSAGDGSEGSKMEFVSYGGGGRERSMA
ncbi:hypothetical protein EDD18DRAFT_1111879 [Armillaria luteobubalina]|uniref:Uncharacterized protein n=1 Tax=Armillaria luteobubalina TaxID=153913 RepID=A0AA39PHD3_9AGAR|nr:hypothetical protein EDD18DRAFT_1111879 [Armillaria luteobubalina]